MQLLAPVPKVDSDALVTSTVVRKIGEMPLVPATIGAILTKGM